ncbi:MAG: PD40 domain-containing protein [Anaerolineae bacterium]|nr:PD40 domain-containing protein [Anaerolineae bacterium]
MRVRVFLGLVIVAIVAVACRPGPTVVPIARPSPTSLPPTPLNQEPTRRPTEAASLRAADTATSPAEITPTEPVPTATLEPTATVALATATPLPPTATSAPVTPTVTVVTLAATKVLTMPAATAQARATPVPSPTVVSYPGSGSGWAGDGGGPGNASYSPSPPLPGSLVQSWRMDLYKPDSSSGLSLRIVSMAARGDTLYAVSSQGILYRLDARTGRVQNTTTLWDEGPRGAFGARMALVGDHLVIGLGDLFMQYRGQRSPSYRSRLVVLEAGGQNRIRWQLPDYYNSGYAWLASGNILLVSTQSNGDLIAFDLATGYARWSHSDPEAWWSLLAADDSKFYLVRRPRGYPAPETEDYLRRQRFVAFNAATGKVAWESQPEIRDDVQSAMLSEGRLILIGWNPILIALSAQFGKELWRSGVSLSSYSPMAAGGGSIVGRVYDVGRNELVGVDAQNGSEKWRLSLADAYPSGLLLTRDDVFVTLHDNEKSYLRRVNAQTGKWVSTVLEETSPSYAYPGTVLAATEGRLLLGGFSLIVFAGQAVTAPSPITPVKFVTTTLPALPLYYESTVSGNGDVWRSLSDGTGAANLTNSGGDDWDPAPAPDGRLVAFESYRTGTSEFWLMRSDGADQHPLAETRNANVYNAHPSWSPDSGQIAFVSNRGGEFQVWVIRPDGSDLHPLTAEGRNTDPAWSPDGKAIAFISNRGGNDDVWLMNADGSAARQVTFTSEREASPAWSPDGRYLAFTRQVSPHAADWGQIIIKRLDGGLEILAPYSQYASDRNPSWSPDGTRLAWARKTEDPGKPQVVIARLDAGAPPAILDIRADPAWAPAAQQP